MMSAVPSRAQYKGSEAEMGAGWELEDAVTETAASLHRVGVTTGYCLGSHSTVLALQYGAVQGKNDMWLIELSRR